MTQENLNWQQAKQLLDANSVRVQMFQQRRYNFTLATKNASIKKFLLSLPALLHVNDPKVRFYVPDAPHGIQTYQLDPGILAGFTTGLFTSSQYNPQVTQTLIKGVYVMGSATSVSFGENSDMDIWVIVEQSLDAAQRQLLYEKLELITAWSLQHLNLETSFYIVDEQHLLYNRHNNTSLPENGMRVKLFLLDEFYRSHLKLAGKWLLWMFLPEIPGMSYAAVKDCYLAHGLINPADWIDLGGIDQQQLSRHAFYTTALWQLNKASQNPFKSYLKILLLEAYIHEYPHVELIATTMKRAIHREEAQPSLDMSLHRQCMDGMAPHSRHHTWSEVMDSVLARISWIGRWWQQDSATTGNHHSNLNSTLNTVSSTVSSAERACAPTESSSSNYSSTATREQAGVVSEQGNELDTATPQTPPVESAAGVNTTAESSRTSPLAATPFPNTSSSGVVNPIPSNLEVSSHAGMASTLFRDSMCQGRELRGKARHAYANSVLADYEQQLLAQEQELAPQPAAQQAWNASEFTRQREATLLRYDPYELIIRKVTSYLEQIQDRERKKLVVSCFMLKLNQQLTPLLTTLGKKLQLDTRQAAYYLVGNLEQPQVYQELSPYLVNVLYNLIHELGYSETDIAQGIIFASWRIKNLATHARLYQRALVKTYLLLSEFLIQELSKPQASLSINFVDQQEYQLIQDALTRLFLHHRNQITVYSQYTQLQLAESYLYFGWMETPLAGHEQEGTRAGYPGELSPRQQPLTWFVANFNPQEPQRNAEHRHVEFKTDFINLVAWSYLNGLVTDATQIKLQKNPYYSAELVSRLILGLKNTFGGNERYLQRLSRMLSDYQFLDWVSDVAQKTTGIASFTTEQGNLNVVSGMGVTEVASEETLTSDLESQQELDTTAADIGTSTSTSLGWREARRPPFAVQLALSGSPQLATTLHQVATARSAASYQDLHPRFGSQFSGKFAVRTPSSLFAQPQSRGAIAAHELGVNDDSLGRTPVALASSEATAVPEVVFTEPVAVPLVDVSSSGAAQTSAQNAELGYDLLGMPEPRRMPHEPLSEITGATTPAAQQFYATQVWDIPYVEATTIPTLSEILRAEASATNAPVTISVSRPNRIRVLRNPRPSAQSLQFLGSQVHLNRQSWEQVPTLAQALRAQVHEVLERQGQDIQQAYYQRKERVRQLLAQQVGMPNSTRVTAQTTDIAAEHELSPGIVQGVATRAGVITITSKGLAHPYAEQEYALAPTTVIYGAQHQALLLINSYNFPYLHTANRIFGGQSWKHLAIRLQRQGEGDMGESRRAQTSQPVWWDTPVAEILALPVGKPPCYICKVCAAKLPWQQGVTLRRNLRYLAGYRRQRLNLAWLELWHTYSSLPVEEFVVALNQVRYNPVTASMIARPQLNDKLSAEILSAADPNLLMTQQVMLNFKNALAQALGQEVTPVGDTSGLPTPSDKSYPLRLPSKERKLPVPQEKIPVVSAIETTETKHFRSRQAKLAGFKAIQPQQVLHQLRASSWLQTIPVVNLDSSTSIPAPQTRNPVTIVEVEHEQNLDLWHNSWGGSPIRAFELEYEERNEQAQAVTEARQVLNTTAQPRVIQGNHQAGVVSATTARELSTALSSSISFNLYSATDAGTGTAEREVQESSRTTADSSATMATASVDGYTGATATHSQWSGQVYLSRFNHQDQPLVITPEVQVNLGLPVLSYQAMGEDSQQVIHLALDPHQQADYHTLLAQLAQQQDGQLGVGIWDIINPSYLRSHEQIDKFLLCVTYQAHVTDHTLADMTKHRKYFVTNIPGIASGLVASFSLVYLTRAGNYRHLEFQGKDALVQLIQFMRLYQDEGVPLPSGQVINLNKREARAVNSLFLEYLEAQLALRE